MDTRRSPEEVIILETLKFKKSIKIKKEVFHASGKFKELTLVGFTRDNKYKEVHCVRECKLSCGRISLGMFMWERFEVYSYEEGEENDNQRIDYVINHNSIKEGKYLGNDDYGMIWGSGWNV
ncbi:hypothetical protein Tco_1446501 [Tanacetum coccineum]